MSGKEIFTLAKEWTSLGVDTSDSRVAAREAIIKELIVSNPLGTLKNAAVFVSYLSPPHQSLFVRYLVIGMELNDADTGAKWLDASEVSRVSEALELACSFVEMLYDHDEEGDRILDQQSPIDGSDFMGHVLDHQDVIYAGAAVFGIATPEHSGKTLAEVGDCDDPADDE